MEHRIITGEGAQWLPFARSCITKLKKLGLPYADQSFEIDGASIKVRVEPGHEYIRIEGGDACILKMDSGAVTFGGTGPRSIWKDDPAYLFDVATTSAYHSKFLYQDAKSEYKTYPSKVSTGQIAGYLEYADERFKGNIFVDRDLPPWFPNMAGPIPANCLSPMWEKKTSPEGVVTYEPLGHDPDDIEQYADIALYEKKGLVSGCPASIFTGRTRLYVQAMYGLPLWEYTANKKGGAKTLKSKGNPINRLQRYEGAGTPALLVKSYVAPNDFKLDDDGKPTAELNEYPDVLLGTSNGLWLDPKTGKHFLLTISGPTDSPSVCAYPLVSSKCGEKLRKWLITEGDKVPKKPLNDEDREHLEAYILAWSLPDVKNKFGTLIGGAQGAWSMGYGWHWNWSGTKAVLVTSDSHYPKTDVGRWNGFMLSSHYDATVSIVKTTDRGGVEVWAANVTSKTVTKDAKWMVPRAWYPICEPAWDVGFLYKVTPEKALTLESCNAPFYAFFRKDELILCKVIGRRYPTYAGERKMSPGWAASDVPGANDVHNQTYGDQGGFFDEIYPAGEYMTYEFTAGKFTTGELIMNTGRSGGGGKVTDKVRDSWYHLMWNGSFYPSGRWYVGFFGNPPAITYVSGPTTLYHYFYEYSWKSESYALHRSESSATEICTPFGDSEAVYIHQNTTTLTRKSAHHVKTHSTMSGRTNYGAGGNNIGWATYDIASAPLGSTGTNAHYGPTFNWANGTGFAVVEDVVEADSEEVKHTYGNTVIDRYAVRTHGQVTTGHQYWHVNTEDYVESRYDTRSAASHSTPVIYSSQCNISVGTDAWFASTVGWA